MAIRNRDEALQALFAAKRAGGGNIFGGPPQAPAPAPKPQPQAAASGGSAQSVLSQLGDRKAPTADGGLNPFSSGFGTSLKNGLGTVLGGAAKAIQPVSKIGVLAAEEFTEAITGREVGGQVDAYGNVDDSRSNWEKLNDPHYGVGELMGDSFGGNKWANRAVGFVGDVALDPLTYLAGGATKSAQAVGKTGRQALAQSAAKQGMSKEVIESVAKYGPAFQDDATRALLNVKDAGIYWGIGEASVRLPGTSALGRGLEKTFAQARDKTWGQVAARKTARGDAGLAGARRATQTGRTIDGWTPELGAKFLNNIDVRKASTSKYRDIYAREAQALMAGWDDRIRTNILHEVENAGTDVAGNINRGRLSQQASQWVDLRDKLYQFAKDNDVNIGDLGVNYAPHRATREAIEFTRSRPQLQSRLDMTAGGAATKTRGILPDQGPQEFDGVLIDFGDAKLATIESALQKAFPGSGVKQWMETNSAVVMERYIDEIAQSVATVDMFKAAVKSGDIGDLRGYSDEMVASASTATRNKEMAKLLKGELARRDAELAGLQKEAFGLQREMAEALHASVDDVLGKVGKERKFLQKDIKAIYDDLKSNADRTVLRQRFVEMKERANKAYSDTVQELDRTEQSLASLEMDIAGRDYGAGLGVQRNAAEESAQLSRIQMLETQRVGLEEALVDYGDAVQAANHLEDMVGARVMAAESMEEVADSPQLLRELMEDLAADDIIEYQTPKTIKVRQPATPRVKALQDKVERLRTQEAADAAVGGMEREAKAAAWRGEAQASAEALDSAADVMLAEVRGLKAEADRIRQWVPKYKVSAEDAEIAKQLKAAKQELHMKRMTQQKALNLARQDSKNAWTVQIRSERLDEMASTLESAKWDIRETYGRNLQAGSAYRDAVELESVKLQSLLLDSEAKLTKATLAEMESSGAGAVVKAADKRTATAFAEVQAYKKRIGELDAELDRLTTNPYERRVMELEREAAAKVRRVATKRSSASFLRGQRPPTGSTATDVAAVLRDVEKLDGYNKWIRQVVDGEFDVVTESAAREFTDVDTLEREIAELVERLANVSDREAAIPALPAVMQNFDGNRRDLLSRVSSEEATVIKDYLGRLQRGAKELQREADAAKYARRRDFPNMIDADAEVARGTNQAARDVGEAFDPVELRRAELEATEARGSITLSEYKELAAMPPKPRKVYTDADYAEADSLAAEMRGSLVEASDQELYTNAGHINTMDAAGQEAQREVDRLMRDAKAAKAAYNQAKRVLGVSDADLRAAAPGGDIGSFIQFDPGYAKRGKGDWVNSLLETPEGLRQAVSDRFGGDWSKAAKAYPEQAAATPGGFDRLSHVKAAEMLGGRARKAGHGSVVASKIPVAARELQSLSALKSVIRKMPPHQRRRLWVEARDLASQTRNRASVERMALEKQIRDKSGMLLEQMDQAAKLRSEALVERQAAQEITDELSGGLADALSGVQAATTSVAAGERGIAVADDAARALDEQWSEAASAVKARDRLVRKELKSDVGRLKSNADRIKAVRDNLGDQATRELSEFDAARAARKATGPDQEKALADLELRRSDLLAARRKLKAASKDKVGPRKGVTDGFLDRRMDEYKALLDDAISDPSDLNARAAADLYDQWMKTTVKMDRLKQGGDDLMDVYEAAQRGAAGKDGGLALDMQRGLADGFASLRSDLYPAVDGLPIDQELNRELTNFMGRMRDDIELKWFDDATKFFKSYATATPGFHVRNFMGATFMNFSDGVSVKATRDSLKLWSGYKKDPENFLQTQPQHVRDAFDAVFGAGAGGSFSAGEIGSGLAKIGNAAKSNRWLRFNRRVGEDLVEGPVRLAAALDTTLKGGDMSSAMARVSRLHFDYADVSKLDQRMKKLIPFWMFMSRNLPLQVEQMWRKPKAYAVYNHFMNNVSVEGDEDEFMPEWMKNAGGVVIGRDGLFGSGKDTVLLPDMQHTGLMDDVSAWSNPADAFLASGNPFITKIAELSLNRSGFMGGELIRDQGKDENGNKYDKSETEKNVERAMYALQSFFTPVGSVQGLSGLSVMGGDSGVKAKDRQLQKALNMMGVPLKQLGERERYGEEMRRQFEGQ